MIFREDRAVIVWTLMRIMLVVDIFLAKRENVKNYSSLRFFMLIKLKILSFLKKEEGTESLK